MCSSKAQKLYVGTLSMFLLVFFFGISTNLDFSSGLGLRLVETSDDRPHFASHTTNKGSIKFDRKSTKTQTQDVETKRNFAGLMTEDTSARTDETLSQSTNMLRSIYTDFWHDSRTVLSHSGIHEESREKLRKLIWENQHPSSCEDVELCTCWTPHGGLFSTVHSMTTCLLAAISQGCTLVREPTLVKSDTYGPSRLRIRGYVDKEACFARLENPEGPSRVDWWECYFEPVSSCQSTFARSAHRLRPATRPNKPKRGTYGPEEPVFEYRTPGGNMRNATHIRTDQRCFNIRRHLKPVRMKTGITSSLLANSELLSFLMRPNRFMRRTVRHWADALGVARAKDMSGALAVHVRHGDKRAVDASEKNHTRIVGVASALVRLYGSRNVLLMTDDPLASRIMHTLPDIDAHSHQGEDAVLSEGKLQPLQVVEVPEESWEQSKSPGRPAGVAISGAEDPAALLFMQVILLSQAEVLIGTQVSNVDRAIVELMAAVRYPPVVFDMYLDAYSPCANRETHVDWAERSERYWKMAGLA